MHQAWVKISQVIPEELTADDIRWLVIGTYACKFFDLTAEALVERAKKEEVVLYRVSEAAVGMIAASFNEREMFIEALAGKDFLKCASAIHDEVKVIALEAGKNRISGWVAREGLKTLYDSWAKPVATLYVEEL